MHSIKAKITTMTVVAIVIATVIATTLGVIAGIGLIVSSLIALQTEQWIDSEPSSVSVGSTSLV